MQKYQGKNGNIESKENKPARPVSAQERKDVKPVQPARPISANNANRAAPGQPTPAWKAARQGEINRYNVHSSKFLNVVASVLFSSLQSSVKMILRCF